MVRLLLIAALLAGCECEAPSPEPEPAPVPVPGSSEPLVRATRADLPDVLPALTVTITREAVIVDAAALIATWPPADRAGDPHVHERVEITGPTPGYRIPAIAAACGRMIELERIRAGAQVSPTVFAVRAAPDVPWRQVIDAIYSGTSQGFSDPRFVLRAPEGDRDVWLSMPVPAVRPALTAARVDPALLDALRELGDVSAETPAPAPAPAPAPEPAIGAPMLVQLRADRTVRVSIGGTPLAPGCGSVHDAPIDVLSSLDPDALARCVDAARGAGPAISSAILAADGTLLFRDVAPVLEALRARYDSVGLGAPP